MASTKRGLFALAAGAVASASVITTAGASPPATLQPSAELIRRWREYLGAFKASKACNEGHGSPIRARLVARHGDLKFGPDYEARAAAWELDPEHAALLQHNRESDRLSNELTDRWEAFMEHPSLTLADAMLKMSAVAEYWRVDPEWEWKGQQHHEIMACVVFDEMQAFVLPQLPPDLSPVGRV